MRNQITANILDEEGDFLSGDFVIKNDNFDEVEKAAIDTGVKCKIKWYNTKDSGGGFWSPSGAQINPYWYND